MIIARQSLQRLSLTHTFAGPAALQTPFESEHFPRWRHGLLVFSSKPFNRSTPRSLQPLQPKKERLVSVLLVH